MAAETTEKSADRSSNTNRPSCIVHISHEENPKYLTNMEHCVVLHMRLAEPVDDRLLGSAGQTELNRLGELWGRGFEEGGCTGEGGGGSWFSKTLFAAAKRHGRFNMLNWDMML